VRPSRLDLALAAILAVWASLEAALLDGPGSTAERVAWALAYTLPLVWRRRWPVGVAVFVAAVVLARVLVAQQGPAEEEGAMPFPALLLAAFTAAVHAHTLRLAIVAGVACYAALVCAVFFDYYTGAAEPSDAAILSFFVVAAWGSGYYVRRRGATGAAEERARIARELHDIVGHSISVISLQAGAAEQLIHKDADRAAEHLRIVQRTASEALGELRRLLSVLREDDPSYAPQPGLGALPALARDSGLEVDVREEGEPRALAPGVDLTAYRIVQEALTNAAKHGAEPRASVLVRYAPGEVVLEVSNRATASVPSVGGHGLIGMRERVELYGGTLETGPHGDRFRVCARLPA
jgi:signal transduction histidine kinase